MRKFAVIAVFAMGLTGCVTYGGTMLRNSKGQAITCSGNWGFGVIGAPIAMAQHAKCISDANKAGYYEIGKPIPPSAVPSPADQTSADAAAGILQGVSAK